MAIGLVHLSIFQLILNCYYGNKNSKVTAKFAVNVKFSAIYTALKPSRLNRTREALNRARIAAISASSAPGRNHPA